MNRLLLATIILALFSPGIQAQNYNPKFDDGLDLAEFIKAATEDPSFQTCVPFPKQGIISIETSNLEKAQPVTVKSSLMPPQSGFIYGSFPRHISANPNYSVGKDYASKLQGNQNPVAQELLRSWDKINTTGSSLLKDANSMDSTDTGLYSEGMKIDQTAASLNQERDKLYAEIDAYNAKCSGQPASTFCTNWYTKLVSWQNDLKNRIATHNKHVEEWRGRVKTFKSVVDNWIGALTAWEQDMLGFISKADNFLYGTNGNCTPTQHDALQREVNTLCSMKRGCEQSNPNDSAKDCPIWRLYYQRNIDCHNARREINQVCYDGGNPIHLDEELKAAQAAEHCWGFIQGNCLKAIAPSIPGRRYGGGF